MMHRWRCDWFELAESICGSKVGGIVHLFGQQFWCVWTRDAFGVWRVEGLRAITESRVIVAIAIIFPNVARTHPEIARIGNKGVALA